jgi:putative transposase
MKKNYQKKAAAAVTGDELVLPDSVAVSMAETGGAVTEGLLALAAAAGLQVMGAMMEESVTALAAPKGCHQADRRAVRHGTEAGSVTLGGRRVPLRRPRVRATDGTGELAVESYEAGLEPVGAEVKASARSTSRSAVSRRFVARAETAPSELMATDLSGLDVVTVMIDGVGFARHCCVVGLGVTINGTKVPLGVVEGDTEHATVVKDLLVDLRDRGLDTTRPALVVIDGAKALAAAMGAVFDHPVIQRCQLHNV